MVLTRLRVLGARMLGALVLGALVLGALVLGAACNQSLFDNYSDGGASDGAGPASCVAPCLADAAADFDGTAGGANQRWRYLDDHRNRTWTPMVPSGAVMMGADPANHITTCSANPSAAACKMLAGALLVSSAGATSAADPALELTAPDAQVIQLSLRVYLPSGVDQTIRLYRNSREDVLFTGLATAGKTLEQTLTLDALARDRFLVAMAPATQGATDVAIQLIATSAGTVFPSACQLAIGFSGATGNTVTDLCKGATLTSYNDAGNPTPVALGADPFAQPSTAADIPGGTYYQSGQTIPQNTELTVQLWIRQRTVVDTFSTAWAFSDLDLNTTGGLGIGIVPGTPRLIATTCTDAGNPLKFADAVTAWPAGTDWHFVRVVQTGGNLNLCLDGQRKASVPVPDGQLKTTFPPYLGKNVVWTPAGQFFDGNIDDVRVFTGALPCN
jgi:Concanavalin A-like lectin/glucanases superfamily